MVYFKFKFTTHFTSYDITVFFINMQILKFKSQLTFVFFAAVIILADLLGNRSLHQRVQKVMVSDLWLVDWRSVLCVSVLQGSLLVIVIKIGGSEKRNCEGGFLNFRVCVFLKSTVSLKVY